MNAEVEKVRVDLEFEGTLKVLTELKDGDLLLFEDRPGFETSHEDLRTLVGGIREHLGVRVGLIRMNGASIEKMPAEQRQRLSVELLRSMSPEERAAVLAEVGG